MAHLIDTMAYSGATPWHGLGAVLPAGSNIDTWIDAAGLTWRADLRPITLAGQHETIDGRKAVVRSDNGHVFDIVSDRYKPVQPREVLEFFRDLSDAHGMQVETAGALKGGAVVWALATNGGKIAIKGKDTVKPYLLLSTSFDGSQATRSAFTTIRVVCNNTLRMSYAADKDGVVSVRHTARFDERDVKTRLGVFGEQFASFEANANYLAETRVTGEQVKALLVDLFGSKDETGALTTYSQNVMGEVANCIVNSPGANMDTARGTAWGVLNGITNFVDYKARARSNDNRLDSAWFGRGDALKGQALNWLADLNPRLEKIAA